MKTFLSKLKNFIFVIEEKPLPDYEPINNKLDEYGENSLLKSEVAKFTKEMEANRKENERKIETLKIMYNDLRALNERIEAREAKRLV